MSEKKKSVLNRKQLKEYVKSIKPELRVSDDFILVLEDKVKRMVTTSVSNASGAKTLKDLVG